jgi:hypothetical protein
MHQQMRVNGPFVARARWMGGELIYVIVDERTGDCPMRGATPAAARALRDALNAWYHRRYQA